MHTRRVQAIRNRDEEEIFIRKIIDETEIVLHKFINLGFGYVWLEQQQSQLEFWPKEFGFSEFLFGVKK